MYFLLRQGYVRGRSRRRLALPIQKGVIFMSIEQLLLMLAFLRPGLVSSISVSKNTVTIRIKK